MAEDQQAAENNIPETLYKPEKIYIKDVSFESPNSPSIFTGEWKPQVSIDLGSGVNRAGDELFEVALHLTVTVKVGDATAYLAEVHQAGIFSIRNATPEHQELVQHVHCLAILYPYASAAITDLVSKGGFPGLMLAPFNFHNLYLQRKQAGNNQDEPGTV